MEELQQLVSPAKVDRQTVQWLLIRDSIKQLRRNKAPSSPGFLIESGKRRGGVVLFGGNIEDAKAFQADVLWARRHAQKKPRSGGGRNASNASNAGTGGGRGGGVRNPPATAVLPLAESRRGKVRGAPRKGRAAAVTKGRSGARKKYTPRTMLRVEEQLKGWHSSLPKRLHPSRGAFRFRRNLAAIRNARGTARGGRGKSTGQLEGWRSVPVGKRCIPSSWEGVYVKKRSRVDEKTRAENLGGTASSKALPQGWCTARARQ